MSNAVSLVLTTVNAPYRVEVDAATLAKALSSVDAAQAYIGPVYAFFSEVAPELQDAFLSECGVSRQNAARIARHLAAQSGQEGTLAAFLAD